MFYGRIWCVVAVALVFLGRFSRHASANFGDFQYGTTITPSVISPAATITTGGPGSQIVQVGVGNFAAPAGSVFDAGRLPSGTEIVVGNLSVQDLGTVSGYLDSYGPTPITISLRILDLDSHQTGVLTFSGNITGEVFGSGDAAAVFGNPFAAASQNQTIGGIIYNVSIIPSAAFAAPGPPPIGGTGLPGTYTFEVHAFLPEPSAAGFIGIVAVGALRRRRTNSGRR